jgi:hypothetical protein
MNFLESLPEDAGCIEGAQLETVLAVCPFNFMNRLLAGQGVKGLPELFALPGKR